LRQQVVELTDRIADQESECDLRDDASEDAQELHAAVRVREESFVEDELVRIGDLLQTVYATVDPHPEFKAVRLLTGRHRGRGRLWTRLEAATNGKLIAVDEPRTVLSSSQLNVLAVSTFMAFNLSIKDLPLEVMALDDPHLSSSAICDVLALLDGEIQPPGSLAGVIPAHGAQLLKRPQRQHL